MELLYAQFEEFYQSCKGKHKQLGNDRIKGAPANLVWPLVCMHYDTALNPLITCFSLQRTIASFSAQNWQGST